VGFAAVVAGVGAGLGAAAAAAVGVLGLAGVAATTGVGAGALDVVVVVAVGPGAEPSGLLSSVKATLITNSLPSAVFFSPLRPFFGRLHAQIPQNRNLCYVH